MLDKSKNYTFMYATYTPLSEGGGLVCNCCNAIIANHVYLKDNKGNTIVVGRDCAKTILKKDTLTLIDHKLNNEKIRYDFEKKNVSFYINKFGFAKKSSKNVLNYLIEENKIYLKDGVYYEK